MNMKRLDRLNAALSDDLIKEIFDQVKNYLICAFLFAIGVVAFREKTGFFFGQITPDSNAYSGIGIIALSFFLFCLNLFYGVRKISRYRYGSIYSAVLVLLYIIISVRVIELAWNFRMTGNM